MKPTLIIVDDLKEIRDSLYGALVEEFSIVAGVSDGRQAVEAVRTHRPQLVLMDVVMPEMSGIEATRAIQALPEPPKVIMLSGLKDEHVVLQALEAGACEYLFKPIEPERLKKVLWEIARHGLV